MVKDLLVVAKSPIGTGLDFALVVGGVECPVGVRISTESLARVKAGCGAYCFNLLAFCIYFCCTI